MEYLQDFGTFNPKNKLDATTYVNYNFVKLKQIMNLEDSEMEDDDIKKSLIDYFTRFPDQISQVSLNTFGVPKNYVPRLNNLGGVVKYR